MSRGAEALLEKQAVPELQHVTDSLGGLLLSGLGRFGLRFEAPPQPWEHSLVILFVVGGISTREIRELQVRLPKYASPTRNGESSHLEETGRLTPTAVRTLLPCANGGFHCLKEIPEGNGVSGEHVGRLCSTFLYSSDSCIRAILVHPLHVPAAPEQTFNLSLHT